MYRTEGNARTVLRKTNFVYGTSKSAPGYVCPSCRFIQRAGISHTANSTVLSRRSTSSGTSQNSSVDVRKRSFSRASPVHATEQEVQSSHSGAVDLRLSIGPLAKRKAESSNTLIRKSLRAWSEQNVHIKKENAPSEIPATGRVTQLPNALFVKKHGDPSEDAESDDTDVFGDDDEMVESHIEPGSLFSHTPRIGRERNYAVYLGNVGVQAQLVLQNGTWLVEKLRSARIYATGSQRTIVRNFLDAEEIKRLQTHLPKDQILRPGSSGEGGADLTISGPLDPGVVDFFLTRVNKFAKDVDAFERTHGTAMNAAFEKIAHETEFRIMSLREYVWQALELDLDKLDGVARMAAVKLLQDKDHIRVVSTAETLSVICYPKMRRANMERVIHWAREYQDAAARASLGKDVSALLRNNPLTAFIDKSRRLILQSRKMRAPTKSGALGPCATNNSISIPEPIETGETFSKADKLIIDFIWAFAVGRPTPQFLGPWRIQPITSLILRAIGAYPELDLEKGAARLFLREIGCLDPWATGATKALALPVPGGPASAKADALFRQAREAAIDFDSRAKELKRMPSPDMMAHLRRDWGSKRVMAIDPGTTQRIEDAISVEQDARKPDHYWIHVHVTHLTAFFEPESIIARYARHQGASFYTLDGSKAYNMVPIPIASHFSLKAGSPVLTISTLLADDGSVQDVRIAPGVIHHVDSLTPRAVTQVLSLEESEDKNTVLVVGKVRSVTDEPATAKEIANAAVHKEDLKLIQRLLESRFQRRRIEMPKTESQSRIDSGTTVSIATIAHKYSGIREHNSIHWKGDPGIILSGKRVIERRATDESRRFDVVTQAMRLAAESAGSWLTQRKVPATFLGTQAPPDIRQTQEGDRVNPDMFVRSSIPSPHRHLNMKAYTTCTSPLRRFADMLALFQIDSYLRAEANGMIEPGAPISDGSLLAFDKAAVDDYLKLDVSATDAIEATRRETKLDYSFQALFRAFHFKEAQLPDVWEVIINECAMYSATGARLLAKGSLVPFGLPCVVEDSPEGWADQAGFGHFLPVRIKMIEPDLHRVTVIPVGPSGKTQTVIEPMQMWSEANIDRTSRSSNTQMKKA